MMKAEGHEPSFAAQITVSEGNVLSHPESILAWKDFFGVNEPRTPARLHNAFYTAVGNIWRTCRCAPGATDTCDLHHKGLSIDDIVSLVGSSFLDKVTSESTTHVIAY